MKKSNTAEKVEQNRGKDRNGDVLEISRHCSCAGPEFPSMLNPGKGFPFFVTTQKIRLR